MRYKDTKFGVHPIYEINEPDIEFYANLEKRSTQLLLTVLPLLSV